MGTLQQKRWYLPIRNKQIKIYCRRLDLYQSLNSSPATRQRHGSQFFPQSCTIWNSTSDTFLWHTTTDVCVSSSTLGFCGHISYSNRCTYLQHNVADPCEDMQRLSMEVFLSFLGSIELAHVLSTVRIRKFYLIQDFALQLSDIVST